MVTLRDSLPDRLDDHRMSAGLVGSGHVTGGLRLSCPGSRRLWDGHGLGSCEELVHDFGAGGDDGSLSVAMRKSPHVAKSKSSLVAS
jgi:hypothetical protein